MNWRRLAEPILAEAWKWRGKIRRELPILFRVVGVFGLAPFKLQKHMRTWEKTLRPQSLNLALSCFYEIRPILLADTGFNRDNLEMVYKGYVDIQYRARFFQDLEILSDLARVRKRTFTPQRAYLTGNLANLFSGVELTASVSSQGGSRSSDTDRQITLSMFVAEGQSLVSGRAKVNEYGDQQSHGVIEEVIHNCFRREMQPGSGQLLLRFLGSTLVDVIESAADAEVAAKLLEGIEPMDLGSLASISSRDRMKLALVSGREEHLIASQIGGWRLTPMVELETREPNLSLGTGKTPIQSQTIRDVSVFKGGSLVKAAELILNDKSQHPSLGFVAGRTDHIIGSHSNLRACFAFWPADGDTTIDFLEEGILLSGRADGNWFHWLIEYLPRLFSVDNRVSHDVPLIVSEGLPEQAYEVLSIATDREFVKFDRETNRIVRKLHVPGPHLYHPEAIHLWGRPEGTILDNRPLQALRRKVLEHFPVNPVPDRKVLLVRTSQSRGLLNQRKLVRTAVKAGFEVLDPSKLSFGMQVQVFREAENLILVGGGSMANLIFVNQHAKVAVIVSRESTGYPMPGLLAALGGGAVTMFHGKVIFPRLRSTKNELLHSDYVLEKKTLHQLMTFFN